MNYVITEEHKRALKNDGIVKLPGLLDQNLLDEITACFEWSVTHPGPIAKGPLEGENTFFVDNNNPAAQDMYNKWVLAASLGNIAAELWESEYVGYYGEEVFWKKGNWGPTHWHQDSAYLPWAGEDWCNFWIPLCDMPADYAVQVVRGSHKGIMYDGTTFNPQDPTDPLWGEAADFPRLPDISADLKADPDAWDIVSFDVALGDVVVLNPHCLHAGGPTDENLPERRNLALRFFGDKSYYSAHLPDVPGIFDHRAQIASAKGGFLKNGDLYRPATALQANIQ